MDPGLWVAVLIAGNGYSWSLSVMDGTDPVDTTGWDVKVALRVGYPDEEPALLLTVGAGVTVGQGDDGEVIEIVVSDEKTAEMISDATYAAETVYQMDVTVLLVGAPDWMPLLRGTWTLLAAATRLDEDGS